MRNMTTTGGSGAGGKEAPVDPVLDALSDLGKALDSNEARMWAIRARIADIVQLRAQGRSYREIVGKEERPLIVEMATDNLASLLEAGSRLRKAEARALRDEGLTMAAIAELFGVTRQRIAELLRAEP